MATASRDSGVVVLWDLNQKKIWTQLKIPHSGRALSSVAFIPNEPVLVTASEDDNSIKMWLFEKGQSEPRLLRERTGHAEAPTKIRFYGGLDDPTNHGARNLITCSTDGTLRDISLLNELQSMNFS
jgi:U3 small nucleolar RNA-associated protein 21